MSQEREITRREFSVESLMALFAGVTITVSACSDDAPNAPGGNNRVGSVGTNHGHTATVTSAQIMDGDAVVLDIRGSADHPHTVNLTGAEVTQIGAGQRVTKTSSSESSASTALHDHTVTFN